MVLDEFLRALRSGLPKINVRNCKEFAEAAHLDVASDRNKPSPCMGAYLHGFNVIFRRQR